MRVKCSVTHWPGYPTVCWCIQWCTWGFVFLSEVGLFCCNPAAGSHEAGAKPPQDSSCASSLSHWPSRVFWWTSWACAASAALERVCLVWSRRKSPLRLCYRFWRRSTSLEMSKWNPPMALGMRTAGSPCRLQTRLRGPSIRGSTGPWRSPDPCQRRSCNSLWNWWRADSV